MIDSGLSWLRAALTLPGRSLSAYYKSAAALAWSGDPAAARALLAQVTARFGTLDTSSIPWAPLYPTYPASWLAVAAFETNEPTLGHALLATVLPHYNPATGGFRLRDEQIEEVMTTSIAGLACLRAGRLAEARGVLTWLERLLDLQPDLARGLYHVYHPDQGLLPGDESVAWLVSTAAPRQWYFQYGIAAAFLADYTRVTSDPAGLALAVRYLAASAHHGPRAFETLQSGKLGWGAAWVHRQTGDPAHRAIVDSVIAGLARLQSPDGAWSAAAVYQSEPAGASDDGTCDVTSEMVALLSQMGAPRA